MFSSLPPSNCWGGNTNPMHRTGSNSELPYRPPAAEVKSLAWAANGEQSPGFGFSPPRTPAVGSTAPAPDRAIAQTPDLLRTAANKDPGASDAVRGGSSGSFDGADGSFGGAAPGRAPSNGGNALPPAVPGPVPPDFNSTNTDPPALNQLMTSNEFVGKLAPLSSQQQHGGPFSHPGTNLRSSLDRAPSLEGRSAPKQVVQNYLRRGGVPNGALTRNFSPVPIPKVLENSSDLAFLRTSLEQENKRVEILNERLAFLEDQNRTFRELCWDKLAHLEKESINTKEQVLERLGNMEQTQRRFLIVLALSSFSSCWWTCTFMICNCIVRSNHQRLRGCDLAVTDALRC